MNKTIITVLLTFCIIVAICVGVLYAITPEPEVNWTDPHTNNPLIEVLGIERTARELERMLAIKTYEGEPDFSEMLKLSTSMNMEYYELDEKSEDYLLVIPFETNGWLDIYNVSWDGNKESYKIETTKPIFSSKGGEQMPENYSLLLKYTRPGTPQYAIRIFQEKGNDVNGTMQYQTATYMIANTEYSVKSIDEPYIKIDTIDGKIDTTTGRAVTKIQLVKDDIDMGTEAIGVLRISNTGAEEENVEENIEEIGE